MPRRRQATSGINAEINVTSLVDVAFTLLVIFIITAPIMQGGVEVKVPRAAAETISTPDGVVVSITRGGDLFIGDAQVELEQLPDALRDVVAERQTKSVYLRADQDVPYGRVLRVLGSIKALDIATVGLVAEPETAGSG